MKNKDALKEYFNSLPEVKRIHELEGYIDSNPEIKNKFAELKELQKRLVSSEEYNQLKQAKMYQDEYNQKKEELLSLPFVEEYLELLDEVDQMLVSLTSEIEYKLDKKING